MLSTVFSPIKRVMMYLICTHLGCAAFAQSSSVMTFAIRDVANEAPLHRAYVFVKEVGQPASSTDLKGNVTIEDLPTGELAIVILKDGFLLYEGKVSVEQRKEKYTQIFLSKIVDDNSRVVVGGGGGSGGGVMNISITPSTLQVAEVGNFTITLNRLQRVGGLVRAEMTFLSKTEDIDLYFDGNNAWLFDGNGIQYQSRRMKVAATIGESYTGQRVIQGVSTAVVVEFENVPETVRALSLLEVNFRNGPGRVQYRGVRMP